MNENGVAIRAGLGNYRRSDGAARPTTVSIISGCPNSSVSRSATVRATTSVKPPAGAGTMTRIGLVGQDCCAPDCPAKPASSTETRAQMHLEEAPVLGIKVI